MYTLFDSQQYGPYSLWLSIPSAGLEAFTSTVG
jgi:hypothetical protein